MCGGYLPEMAHVGNALGNFNQFGRCDLPSDFNLWRHYMAKVCPGLDLMHVANMKQLIFATATAVAVFGGACAPSQAADLGRGYRSDAGYVRTGWGYSNWRDRCAWAGYYCLYAWDRYVYSYPWDDRPSSLAYYSRRHRHRY